MRFLVVLLLLGYGSRLSAQSDGPHYPMNASNMNSNVTNNAAATVFLDPLYGSSPDEWSVNTNSMNYWADWAGSHPFDQASWFNYYKASRFVAEGNNTLLLKQAELDTIAAHLKRYSPGTWEQLIVEYWNSNRDPKAEVALNSAYALRKDDPLTLRFMTGMEYLHGRNTQSYSYYLSWKKTGDTPLSTESYAYNVLKSLPADAVLFTNGEMDTYPLIYQMQLAGNTSVKIISIALCDRAVNREALFKAAGLTLPDNFSPINGDFIRRVASVNSGKKIYVASTCGPALLNALSENLYCTGLAFRYSETPIDHLTFLRNNVGTKFHLDGVGKAVRSTNRFDQQYAGQLEMNYYLPLLLAADSYEAAGNVTRAKDLREKAIKVRTRAGYEEPLRYEGQ